MITLAQISALKDVQESHMGDVVTIINNTVTQDSYGDVVYSGVTVSGISCGFEFTGGKKYEKGELVLVDCDAVVRLPVTTTINSDDTVILTQKAGVTHNQTFTVMESPRYNSSVIHVNLKRTK